MGMKNFLTFVVVFCSAKILLSVDTAKASLLKFANALLMSYKNRAPADFP